MHQISDGTHPLARSDVDLTEVCAVDNDGVGCVIKIATGQRKQSATRKLDVDNSLEDAMHSAAEAYAAKRAHEHHVGAQGGHHMQWLACNRSGVRFSACVHQSHHCTLNILYSEPAKLYLVRGYVHQITPRQTTSCMSTKGPTAEIMLQSLHRANARQRFQTSLLV
ncbi:hypothetical protein SB00610_01029 [Klebsiella quasipneumoniae subsp. similipneumoniae]|nr:hypothetical protein SB00610_01029 [Klebsiella quasipneumoniae subsp. similipneumoniae]